MDPRFKRDFFSASVYLENAERKIRQELLELREPHPTTSFNTANPTPAKGIFANRHKFRGPEDLVYNVNVSQVVSLEYDTYISEPVVDDSVDPLAYWETEERFPKLRKLALRYLIIMGTSVPAERLFSQASNILSLKRNRLTPENLSKFLFISKCSEEDFQLRTNK